MVMKKESEQRSGSIGGGGGDMISDSGHGGQSGSNYQLTSFLESLTLPTEVKDVIAQTLDYVIRRTRIINRRMTQLVKFFKEQQTAMQGSLVQAVDKVRKHREAVEDQVDFLDAKYKDIFKEFEHRIQDHGKEIKDFTDLMKIEYVDFFKNR
jgi:hypothetical protein